MLVFFVLFFTAFKIHVEFAVGFLYPLSRPPPNLYLSKLRTKLSHWILPRLSLKNSKCSQIFLPSYPAGVSVRVNKSTRLFFSLSEMGVLDIHLENWTENSNLIFLVFLN